jgi:hypothetical protein
MGGDPTPLSYRSQGLGSIAEDAPITQVAAQLGDSRKSLTIDTYSHVRRALLQVPALRKMPDPVQTGLPILWFWDKKPN